MNPCPHCRSTDLVMVEMSLAAGPLLFAHCRACEHRWWTDLDGARVIALNDVLSRAAA